MRTIKKILRSFRYGFEGLFHAYRVDQSFRLEINVGLPVYLLVGYLLSPLTAIELLLLVASYLLILIIELVNTAFEKMLDRLHPSEHELIKRSKDIASAAVLVAFLFGAVIVGVLTYDRLTHVRHDRAPEYMIGTVAV